MRSFAKRRQLFLIIAFFSGFDAFKEELGITKDSLKRGMSLDVQYDEQDMIKVSTIIFDYVYMRFFKQTH